jgi:phage replication-related protein YjqB (UPF0714/DUF867 family)
LTALAFFGLFFLVLAAVALHGWAANSRDVDGGGRPAEIRAPVERELTSVGWSAR